jgi:hypothetical protein
VIEDARATLGFKSKTDTVVYALKEVVRKGYVQGLTGLFGKVHIELDLGNTRGRPAWNGQGVIVVDSSVWIRAFRSRSSPEAITLSSLLDADAVALAVPVRTELLMGARAADRSKLAGALRSVPVLYPTDDTWRTIDS